MTREQAINYLISSGFSEEQIQEIIKALEQEPKTGYWIVEDSGNYNGKWSTCYCSNCKDYYTRNWREMNYCPNCGAKMKSEEQPCKEISTKQLIEMVQKDCGDIEPPSYSDAGSITRQIREQQEPVLDKVKDYINHIRNTGLGKKKSLEFIEKYIDELKLESEG